MGHKKVQRTQKLSSVGQHVFSNREFWGSKVDQEAVFDFRRSKVTKQLCSALLRKVAAGLQFDHEWAIEEEVGEEVTQDRVGLIKHPKRNC